MGELFVTTRATMMKFVALSLLIFACLTPTHGVDFLKSSPPPVGGLSSATLLIRSQWNNVDWTKFNKNYTVYASGADRFNCPGNYNSTQVQDKIIYAWFIASPCKYPAHAK